MRKQHSLLVPALAFVAASAVVIIFHLINIPVHSVAGQIIGNGLHAPGFGLVAIFAYVILRRFQRARIALLLAATYSFGLALAAEFAQFFSSRDASFSDLVADLLGIGGFLALAVLVDRGLRPRLSTPACLLFGLFGAVAFTSAMHPAVLGASVLYSRNSALPQIASFDERWERDLFRPLNGTPMKVVKPGQGWPIAGGRLVALELSARKHAGLVIDPYPDWRSFGYLEFVAAIAGDASVRAEIRISDSRHNDRWTDRYNGRFELTTEPQRFQVPLDSVQSGAQDRHVDLSDIVRIVLVAHDAPAGTQLLVDDFRLQEAPSEDAVTVTPRRRRP